MKSKKYKIIFSDLDGTLLNSKHILPQRTKQKIRELINEGVRFVPVSGRIPEAIFPYAREIGVKMPVSAYSGALTLDENEKSLSSIKFSYELASEILSLLKQRWPFILTTVYLDNSWYVEDISSPKIIEESLITNVKPVETRFAKEERLRGGIHKILGMCAPEEGEAAEKLLSEKYPQLSVCRSSEVFLEIMHKDAKKSTALNVLCQKFSLKPQEAVAFGDNFNDIDMLTAAGLGVAMANSPQEVKKHAGIVTLSNDEEGLLHILNRIF